MVSDQGSQRASVLGPCVADPAVDLEATSSGCRAVRLCCGLAFVWRRGEASCAKPLADHNEPKLKLGEGRQSRNPRREGSWAVMGSAHLVDKAVLQGKFFSDTLRPGVIAKAGERFLCSSAKLLKPHTIWIPGRLCTFQIYGILESGIFLTILFSFKKKKKDLTSCCLSPWLRHLRERGKLKQSLWNGFKHMCSWVDSEFRNFFFLRLIFLM